MELPYKSQHQTPLQEVLHNPVTTPLPFSITTPSALTPLDKLYNSILKSMKDLPAPMVPEQIRAKIIRYIAKDRVPQLLVYIHDEAISLSAEIGSPGSNWNILHYCCKYNATDCLSALLRIAYQEIPESIVPYLNEATAQGLTPIMISVINKSVGCVRILFSVGSIDIYSTNIRKQTVYDMAHESRNEVVIRLVIQYEAKCKKKMFLNKEFLTESVEMPLTQSWDFAILKTTCIKLFNQLCWCLKEEDPSCQTALDTPKHENSRLGEKEIRNNVCKVTFTSPSSYSKGPDFVPIGILESKYMILWRRAAEVLKLEQHHQEKLEMSASKSSWPETGSKLIQSTIKNAQEHLFKNYSSLDIQENNIILPNNIILFQSLAQHSWLLRRILRAINSHDQNNSSFNSKDHQIDAQRRQCIEKMERREKTENSEKKRKQEASERIKSGQRRCWHKATLYPFDGFREIYVDDYIPFIGDRNEPMFLSDCSETWPMILQKALAKLHGGYLKLSELCPFTLLSEMTSFYTSWVSLQSLKEPYEFLAELSNRGYLYMLELNPKSDLIDPLNPNLQTIVHVATLYEKNKLRLALVNCPYILQTWKDKEKEESLQLKLVRTHYSKSNQMCVWIPAEKLCHYFTRVLYSSTESNVFRTEAKLGKLNGKKNRSIFFRLRISKRCSSGERVRIGVMKNGSYLDLGTKSQIEGWVDDGVRKAEFHKGDSLHEQLIEFSTDIGDYLLRMELEEQSADDELILICWSVEAAQPELVEHDLGAIEWLGCTKKYLEDNWIDSESPESLPYRVQKISDLTLIIASAQSPLHFAWLLIDLKSDELLQGTLQLLPSGKTRVLMVRQTRFFYAVFKGSLPYFQFLTQPRTIQPPLQNSNLLSKGYSAFDDK